ncbi:MAG: methyl-accepting chemotaxis protein [Oscillospiraceae bacterium]|nr:methyl-accepting chemotaxis protein [Oscillospiraceae bacterium]
MLEEWAREKSNRIVLIMNIIICSALTIGYFMDYLKGRKTVVFVLVFLIATIMQLCINIVAYKKKKDSVSFKYVGVAGYLVVYCFAMFSSDTYFTYTYVFPMLVLYILYYDVSFIKVAGISAVALNIGKIAFQLLHGHFSDTDITSYTVQMASVVIFAVGAYFLTNMTMLLSQKRIDELTETNRNVTNMAEKAKESNKAETELVNRIAEIIRTFVAGTKQVADGAQSLAYGSSEQSASVDELTISVSQINSMAKENLEVATAALNEVLQAGNLMTACSDQMEQMLAAMRTIDDKSKSILRTTKVIDDIAFQTNILALNAAVEAARAGQHGKGFGVVADEVRSLASKSAEAAKETSDSLTTSSQSIEEGNLIVEKVSASLHAIVEIAEKNAQQIAKVQSISASQSEAMERVNAGIEKVSEVIKENNATAQASAASSQEMNTQAYLLERLINEFQDNNISTVSEQIIVGKY